MISVTIPVSRVCELIIQLRLRGEYRTSASRDLHISIRTTLVFRSHPSPVF